MRYLHFIVYIIPMNNFTHSNFFIYMSNFYIYDFRWSWLKIGVLTYVWTLAYADSAPFYCYDNNEFYVTVCVISVNKMSIFVCNSSASSPSLLSNWMYEKLLFIYYIRCTKECLRLSVKKK